VSRSLRSTAPGVSNGTLASATRALARGDALLHRGFRDQEGARDLLHGEARDDAQRERDLLGRRQFGMAADEQEAQDIVAIMRAVEPLGNRVLGVAEIGDCLIILGQRLLLAGALMSSIATLRPTMISHAAGSRGGPFAASSSARAGSHSGRLLGGVEIAEITEQRADRLGTRRRQRGIDQAVSVT